MSIKRFLIFLPLIFVLVIHTGCRQEDEPATPSPSDTAVPTPTIPPIPTEAGLGLVPVDNEAALQPKLIGQNPAAGEEAALDGFFELYFDQPMDAAVTANALQIVTADGESVAGEVSWPQPRIMRFKPDRALKPNSSYRATLADTAVSASGTSLLEGLSLTFNTIGDLAVSQVSPAPDAEEVAIDTAVTVIFNRPVIPLMIAEEQVNLPNPLIIKPDINGQGEWINTSVYVFRPDDALIGRQTYTARVNTAAVNNLSGSSSGALMAEDYEWSFTVTAPTIRYFSLVDVTDSPRDGYENLRLDQPFQIYFQQPM